jgi:hypothetical protein
MCLNNKHANLWCEYMNYFSVQTNRMMMFTIIIYFSPLISA